MSQNSINWLNTGLLGAVMGAVIALAEAVKVAVSRIVPKRQTLSDEEFRMLQDVHKLTTARDEDGVPLNWFPVYARKQNDELVQLTRQLVHGIDRMVVLTDETKELLRQHAEELREFKHEVG